MPRSVKLNEQMRAESRRKILATASSLFSQKGYFNVRIAEIARQAEMSPGNIYWYFESKEAILKAILHDFFSTYEEMLVQAETFTGDGRAKILHLIALQISTLEEYGKNTDIYMSILGHGGHELIRSLGFDPVAIGRRFHQHLHNILSHAIQEEVIAVQDPEMLAVLYFSFFNGLQATYSEEWRQFISVEALTQAVLRLLGAHLQPERN